MKKFHLFTFFLLFTLFVLYPTQASAEKTVVIDPGHGGNYSGTTGYSGVSTGYYEKHFNLEVGKKLRNVLEANGYKVHMTRDDDTHFHTTLRDDLKQRMEVANGYVKGNNDNSIFLSIHSNSLPSNPYMRGYETYFFDIDRGISDTYPPDPMQIEYSPESKRLSHTIHNNVLEGTPLKEGRGIVPGNLYVTRNAQMPSALLEFGYMSNPDEERLIKTDSFQEKAAQSVLKGVNEFFRVYEVYSHDGTKLKMLESKEEALAYAKTQENVYVFDKFNQKRIYDNIDQRYGVYHVVNTSIDKLFTTKEEALEYAKDWKHTRVVDNKEDQILWSNYLSKDFEVVHPANGILFEGYDAESAIAYAKDWRHTKVVDKTTGEIIWTNYLSDKYEVSHSEKGLLKKFYQESEAIEYAKQWENTKVTNKATGKVVWNNIDPNYTYNFETTEVAGTNRIETAIEVSKQLYPNGFTGSGERTVVLATAFEFADALSAGPLAAQLDNAPILLSKKQSLDPKVLEELNRLNAEKVIMLGGEGALSADVENQLRKDYTVERIAGTNRIETNLEINKRLSGVKGVFVASSRRFPDALEASSIAAANGWSIVLTKENMITEESLDYLETEEVAILGGTGVVAKEVEKELIDQNGGDRVVRLAGTNRYETVAAALDYFEDDMQSETVLAATGNDYPDALTASSISARTSAPLILVGSSLDHATKEALTQYGHQNVVDNLQVIGGVIKDENRKAMADILN